MKAFLPIMAALAVSVTVSAQVVRDSLELSRGVGITPSDLLRGEVAGLRVSSTDGNPSGVTNVLIRGLNSVRGNNEPLWIVDGAILSNTVNSNLNAFWQSRYEDNGYTSNFSQMDNWNLYDIESIQVLKNTSATALYGSRGANGVIIVTTKMPSEEKMSVELDSNVGVNVSEVSSPYIHPSISHNHSIALGSTSARTRFRLSLFFRDVSGVVKGSGSDFAGLRVLFDTKANSTVHFGMNFAVSGGSQNAQYCTAWYGAPSTMLAIREITPLDGRLCSAEGWLDGYSDGTRVFRTTDSFYLDLNFTPSFRWKNSVSLDVQTNNRYVWFDETTAFGKDNTGCAGLVMASLLNADYKSSLQFGKYFGKHHFLNLEGGFEAVFSMNKFNTMNGTNFLISDLGARGFGFRESFDDPADFEMNNGTAGLYALAGYDYRKIAGVNALFRADRNTRFDDSFIAYPSISAYFNIGRLVLPEKSALSTLRIEGGYGAAGYGKYMPYEIFSCYSSGFYPNVSNQVSAYYDGYQRLMTKEYEFSVKTGFLKDRILLDLAYFNRNTADGLSLYKFGRNTDSGIWVKQPKETASFQESVIRNSGLEFNASATILRGRDFNWGVSANLAWNANRLISVSAEDAEGAEVNPSGLIVNRNVEGSPVSSLYGNILDSEYVVTGEGVLGSPVPTLYGGLQTTINYKSFTLDARAEYAAGHKILNMNRMLYTGQSTPSNIYVEDGDYLRLSRLSLLYKVPVGRIKWIRSLDLSLTATNLFTLTKYSGWNPDVNSFGTTNLSTGIDYGSYPLVRTIMLGAHFKF